MRPWVPRRVVLPHRALPWADTVLLLTLARAEEDDALLTAEMRRQLDTAIQWGRFAELFDHEADTGELILETAEAGEAGPPG